MITNYVKIVRIYSKNLTIIKLYINGNINVIIMILEF